MRCTNSSSCFRRRRPGHPIILFATILLLLINVLTLLPASTGFQITFSPREISSSELNFALSSWKPDALDKYSYERQTGEIMGYDNKHDDDALLNAAAAITQESCALLGVKSLGVDYGTVRTGVAVTVGYDPKPLAILSDLNATETCDKIVQMAASERVSQVILGLPFHKNGTVAEQTNLTVAFAEELAATVVKSLGPDVPVFYFDERYTSKEAAARLRSKNPNEALYGMLDADAACIILENYYTDNGVGAERVRVPEDLLETCTAIYREKQAKEDIRIQSIANERDEKLRRRRESILRDRQLELERQASGGSAAQPSKKKKKKKKR
jgi:putative holliday junction resolvase